MLLPRKSVIEASHLALGASEQASERTNERMPIDLNAGFL